MRHVDLCPDAFYLSIIQIFEVLPQYEEESGRHDVSQCRRIEKGSAIWIVSSRPLANLTYARFSTGRKGQYMAL
jgi:hypothetical protein